jgi:hypothetical protein
MPLSPLASKMKRKPGQRVALINAPEGYRARLGPLPGDEPPATSLKGSFDWVQVFVKTRAGLDAILPKLVPALRPDGLLWIPFPKGSSKLQTDLTRDTGWEALRRVDLKWINLISVDETWSAFSLRPYKPGEKRQNFR